jgi:hypothetical protein
LFGGSNGWHFNTDGTNNDDFKYVYILTLPSFRWIKVTGAPSEPRGFHHCQIIGGRQMLVVGGYDPTASGALGANRDPWTNGLGIFDMTALKWASSYNSSQIKYQRSDIVTNSITQK